MKLCTSLPVALSTYCRGVVQGALAFFPDLGWARSPPPGEMGQGDSPSSLTAPTGCGLEVWQSPQGALALPWELSGKGLGGVQEEKLHILPSPGG